MRPLYGASLNTMIVVTLGLFLVLYGTTGTIWNQSTTRNLPEWFSGDQVDVLGVNLTYEQLITVGCAVVVAVALWALFKRTRMGVSMRAVVDDPALASLTGARPSRIAGLAWMIGFMLAGLAGILLAPGTGMSIEILSELVIFGYAAAIVGRLRTLPLTFLGAMILGIGGRWPSATSRQRAQRRHRRPAHGPAHRRPDPAAPGHLDRRPRGPPPAPQDASLRTDAVGRRRAHRPHGRSSALITGTNLYTVGVALATSSPPSPWCCSRATAGRRGCASSPSWVLAPGR